MINRERMLELKFKRKEIYILTWCSVYKDLHVYIVKLNENFYIGNKGLYYFDRCIADYNMCFEDIALKYQRMNGVVEDCNFMYSYKDIEEDV